VFRFRLQRVLELRERREQAVATELVQAKDAASAARETRESLESARTDLASAPAGASSVGELLNLAFLLEQLDVRVSDADTAVGEADEAVNRVQDALRVAFQDRRALDLLRERHLESWRAAETQLDRQTMDEIALTRFTQAAANRAASSTHDRQ
jgi:flagellar export protein FliJ